MGEQQSVWKHRLVIAIKIAVAAVVVGFVWRTLVDAWHQLGEYPWQLRGHWIAAAAAFYLAALLPPALFWYAALRALGQQPSFWEAIRAYYVGHLGKYVPGKAMVIIIRAGLIRGERVDTGMAAASVFLESLTWISVGAVLAAGYLATSLASNDLVFWLALAVIAATGIPTLPHVFPRLAKLAGVGKHDPSIVEKLDGLGVKTTVLGWVLMAGGWVLFGLANWSTFRAMGLPPGDGLAELPRYTAAASLAIVVGFVTIIAPAGLGVREAILAKVMVPYLKGITNYAELVAWGAAILFRLVSVVSELGISGILYGVVWIRAKSRAKVGPPPDNERSDNEQAEVR